MATTAEELDIKITAKMEELENGLNKANAKIDEFAHKTGESLNQTNKHLQNTGGVLNEVLGNWVIQIGLVTAAFKGLQIATQTFNAGIQFNSTIEQARLGIASLITAQAKLTDEKGRTLQGQEALNAATGIAQEQIDKLRIAGLQTAATTQQLVEAYQQAIGVGLSVGLSFDQIRTITIQTVQAAGALGVPMVQLNQEVRSILDGTIDMNSRVAKSLQISNAMVEKWKEGGVLFQKLNERMKTFNDAGQAIAKTWEATKSNIGEARDAIAGTATSGFMEQLGQGMNDAMGKVFDINTAKISGDLEGLLTLLHDQFSDLGGILAQGIGTAVDKIKELSKWIDQNRGEITAFGQTVENVVGIFGRLLEHMVKTVEAIANIKIAGFGLVDIFHGLELTLAKMRDTLEWWTSDRTWTMFRALARGKISPEEEAIIKQNPEGASHTEQLKNALTQPEGRAALEPIIRDAATRYKVPPELAIAIAKVESGFNPSATSNAGAAGVMQLMPDTARNLGVADRYNARQNIEGGVKLLGQLLAQFDGDMTKAIAKYNASTKAVNAAIDEKGNLSITKLPGETQDYIRKVYGEMGKKAPGGVTVTPNPQELDEKKVKALKSAQLRADEEDIKAEVAAKENALKMEEAQLKASLTRQEIGQTEYMQKTMGIEERMTAAKVQGMEKTRVLYEKQLADQKKGTAEYVSTQTDIKTIDEQIANARAQHAQKAVTEAADIVKAQKDIAKAIEDTKNKLADIKTGDVQSQMAQAAQAIADKHQEALNKFTAAGNPEGVSLTKQLIDAETAKQQLGIVKAEYDRVIAHMQAQEQELTNQKQADLISEYMMRKRISEINQETADEVDGLIGEYERLAGLLGNPAEFTSGIENMRMEQKRLRTQVDTDVQQITTDFKSGFADAFANIVTGSQKAGEALNSFFKQLEANIARLLANKLTDAIFGGAQGGSGGGGLLGGLLGSLGLGGSGGGSEAWNAATAAATDFFSSAGGQWDTGTGGIYMLHPMRPSYRQAWPILSEAWLRDRQRQRRQSSRNGSSTPTPSNSTKATT